MRRVAIAAILVAGEATLARRPGCDVMESHRSWATAEERGSDTPLPGELQDIGAAISWVLERAELGRLLAERARALADVDGVVFYVWDEQHAVLRLLVADDGKNSSPGAPEIRSGEGVCGLAFARGEPVVIEDYPSWEHALPWAIERGIRAMLAVPLLLGERPVEAMAAGYYSHRPLLRDTVQALALMGRQVGPALEAARLYEAERTARRAAERSADQMARLQAVTARLSGALTPDQVFNVVVEEGVPALGADAGVVVLLSDDGGWLEIARTHGYPPESLEAWWRFSVEAPVPLAEAVRSGEPVLIESRRARDARFPALAEGLRVDDGALVAIPLQLAGRAIGALGFTFGEPRPFDEQDRAFVLMLSRQCAQALERARLYERVQQEHEEHKRADAERVQLMLEKAERARLEGVLLAARTMAHHLNNSLAMTVGYGELVADDPRLPADLREMALEAMRGAQEAAATVTRLQRIARLEEASAPIGVGSSHTVLDLERSSKPL